MANPVDAMIAERRKNIQAAMDELRKWCGEFATHAGVVSWHSAEFYDSIEISGIQVWDSEDGYAEVVDKPYDDEPRADRCILAYKTIIRSMASWPDMLAGEG